MAIDGATVVVGPTRTAKARLRLPHDDGGATCDEIAKLTASDGAADDYFGISVAIDGDTVVLEPAGLAPRRGGGPRPRAGDGGATATPAR